MSPDLERLVRLQELESAIEAAKRTIASHPSRLEAAGARLEEARRAVETARARAKDSHDVRRSLEKEAAVFQSRLAKFKDQLSEVKTNREYQAMQKEIEVAQRELQALEDRILERMMEADALAIEVKEAEGALAARQRDVEAEKKRLTEELAATERLLKTSTEAREALTREIDPSLVALFGSVARARRGVAICPATPDGLCSVCHVRLRPAVFQQVRHNDSVIQCDSCHRILYYVQPPATPTPPISAP